MKYRDCYDNLPCKINDLCTCRCRVHHRRRRPPANVRRAPPGPAGAGRGKSGGMDLRARSVRKAACDKARPLAFSCTPAMAKVKRTPFRSLLSPPSSSEGRSGSAAVLRVPALRDGAGRQLSRTRARTSPASGGSGPPRRFRSHRPPRLPAPTCHPWSPTRLRSLAAGGPGAPARRPAAARRRPPARTGTPPPRMPPPRRSTPPTPPPPAPAPASRRPFARQSRRRRAWPRFGIDDDGGGSGS